MAINNIPAFPQSEPYTSQEGMSMLDYYAAHAPAEPPKWWKPEMENQPIRPVYLKHHLQTEEEKYWLGFYDDENDEWCNTPDYCKENEVPPNIPQHFKEKIARLIKEIEAANIAANQWEEKERYERLVQWPFYYATQMLMRRESYIKMLGNIDEKNIDERNFTNEKP